MPCIRTALICGWSLCATHAAAQSSQARRSGPDTIAISRLSRTLSSDAYRGRGPWTIENTRAALLLAQELQHFGARPVFGNSLMVPFTVAERPNDTVFNVVGIIPNERGQIDGELIGVTAHLDHLGVGAPDARGDSIYNGFLDAAVPMAMVMDVARRYGAERTSNSSSRAGSTNVSPGARGARPLLVMFFNLEEQGLLGSKALVARDDVAPLLQRVKLLIGVDAGAPAGEALEWQLMGGSPAHAGGIIADSLARAHGWTTTATPPRPISDVFPFAEHGVPILFPIPGARWRNYSDAQRADAMQRWDHYHQPSDEWRTDFPWAGTWWFAEWLWEVVRDVSHGT